MLGLQRTFVRGISQATRAKIDSLVHSAPAVLFMKGTPDQPLCGYSRAAVQILRDLHGLDTSKWKTVNVLEDEEVRQGIKEYSDWPTIPQFYVDNEFVGGCDILLNMHQNEELDGLLDNANLRKPDATASEKAQQ